MTPHTPPFTSSRTLRNYEALDRQKVCALEFPSRTPGKLLRVPWANLTTLAQPYSAGDLLIKITDPDLLILQGDVFVQNDQHLRNARVKNNLGNGVYEITVNLGQDFAAGDFVIKPFRHFYDAFPDSVTYGQGRNGNKIVNWASIQYHATEAALTRGPYVDTLPIP